jgi:hypothetical protein
MDKKRPTADRVRPILEAMERSIETARRRRLDGSERPVSTAVPAPPRPLPASTTDGRLRLKARPKRAAVLLPDVDQPLQSRAG